MNATRAPSSWKRRTVARPIPLLPPVITATLPSNLPRFVVMMAPFQLDKIVQNKRKKRGASLGLEILQGDGRDVPQVLGLHASSGGHAQPRQHGLQVQRGRFLVDCGA